MFFRLGLACLYYLSSLLRATSIFLPPTSDAQIKLLDHKGLLILMHTASFFPYIYNDWIFKLANRQMSSNVGEKQLSTRKEVSILVLSLSPCLIFPRTEADATLLQY